MEDVKRELRSQLKQCLKALSGDQRRAWSEQAAALLLASPEYAQARSMMLFVSLPSEIDTRAIAADAWRTGRHVAVPRAHMADRSMEAVLVRDFDRDMVRTPIGVMEPRGNDCLRPEGIDLVLVPGLGFGEAGERIGRGAGFYDRFLASEGMRAITCGYGFEVQVRARIPMGRSDTPIHMLVTERQVRRFGACSDY